MEKEIINFKNTKFIRIKNNKDLEIILSSFGASIFSIKYKGKDITYHIDDKEAFLNAKKHYGKTLGRVCGRLKDAEFSIDGVTYHLDKNENNNTLHSGKGSISFKEFEYQFSENDELFNIVFKYISPDLEGGFPGKVNFVVIYSILKNKNKFMIHFHALTDKLTPINMSNHTYWNLLDDDILNHELYIDADEKIITSKGNKINIGKEKVNNIFDFRISKKIGKDIFELARIDKDGNGYDHAFIFNNSIDKPKLILKSDKLTLKICTDMSMVQIYTNCFIEENDICNFGKDKIYASIAIEPQMYFTSYKDILINKDNPFDRYISYELEEK